MDGGHEKGSTEGDPGDRAGPGDGSGGPPLSGDLHSLRSELETLRAELGRRTAVRDRLRRERDSLEADRDERVRKEAEAWAWRGGLERSRLFRILHAMGLFGRSGGLVRRSRGWCAYQLYRLFVFVCPGGSRRKKSALKLLAPLLNRHALRAERPAAPTIVTCVVSLPTDESRLDSLLTQFARQTYRFLEVILVASTDADVVKLAKYDGHPRVRPLVWKRNGSPAEDLCFVSGELLLEVRGDLKFDEDIVARMVQQLLQSADRNSIGFDGAGFVAGGGAGLVLRRNPRWGPSADVKSDELVDVSMDDAVRALYEREELNTLARHRIVEIPEPGAGVVLRSAASLLSPRQDPDTPGCVVGVLFDDDVDGPYRCRERVTSPWHVCMTRYRETAARLRFLVPRTIWSRSASDALACGVHYSQDHDPSRVRAIGENPGLEPWVRTATRFRIAIQVDDFIEGGMETVIMDLAEVLRALHFEPVLLVLGATGPAADAARGRGLMIREMQPSKKAYEQFLVDNEIELVNGHYSTFGAAICGRLGIPFVQCVHNMYMWFGNAEKKRFQDADAYTQAYVCVSKNVARYSDVGLGLSPSKMVVIPNGCDAGHMDSPENRLAGARIRRELNLTDDARIFLSVASIHAVKAQEILVQSLGLIADDCLHAHLVILGRPLDDEYYARVLRTIKDFGLEDRVHLLGQRSDVSAFHAAADALVMPSFFEGWSLAITEAVLAGLPVISTDVGGAVDQLRGTRGIVVRPEVEDLASIDGARLADLLRTPCFGVRDRIAEAMREVYGRAERRSPLPEHWRSMTRESAYRRYVHVFDWLIAGGSSAAATYWTEPQLDLAFARDDTKPSRS